MLQRGAQAITAFLEAAESAFEEKRLRKITASLPAADLDATHLFVRPVQLSRARAWSFVRRFPTRDETENLATHEAISRLRADIDRIDWLHWHMHTTSGSFQLKLSRKGKHHLAFSAGQGPDDPDVSEAHDRSKQYLIPADAAFLQALGISSAGGHVHSEGRRKYNQINKFVEIIQGLTAHWQPGKTYTITDMGAGSGYLTFAVYHALRIGRRLDLEVTGVELRPHLVSAGNKLAEKLGFSGLRFVAGDILHHTPPGTDLLIALHACDTATDLAIAAGLQAHAEILVLAPCCHKQVRKSMKIPAGLLPALRHGILLERQAELLTDSIRALLMEYAGYTTQVFEFISAAHTAKNTMITARKTQPRPAALDESRRLQSLFGLEEHYLEALLRQNGFNI